MADPYIAAAMRGAAEARPNGAGSPEAQLPPFLRADEFVAGYVPRRALIPSLDIKAGWLYSLTGPTGYAKTSIALAEAVHLALEGRRVAYLAGENADDVRARAILMQHKLAFEQWPDTLRFVDRTFSLNDGMDHVRAEVAAMGGADLIVVDTSPAFQVAAGAIDENSNPEAIQWALRLRELTRLEGNPVVLALCHPIKRPQSIEDCLPRGGGGFIAEVDGNIASWLVAEDGDEKFFEVRWVGKFRGHFEPVTYRVERATCERLVDADGNPVHSVWAERAEDHQLEQAAAGQTEDDDAVIMVMADYPGKSLSEWAKLLGWQMPSGPAKHRVRRSINRLMKHKLAKQGRDTRYHLTGAGKEEAERVAGRLRNQAK